MLDNRGGRPGVFVWCEGGVLWKGGGASWFKCFTVLLCFYEAFGGVGRWVELEVKVFSGLFDHGSRSGGMNKVRSCVALIHMCFRTTLTSRLNVAGLTVLPSLHIFGADLRIPAIGGHLNVNRGTRIGGVVGGVCSASSGFFGRVSTDVHGGYRGLRSIGACLVRFRGFARSLVVLVNGLVGFGLHLPDFVGGALCGLATRAISSVFGGGSFSSTDMLGAIINLHRFGAHLGFDRR